VSQESGVSQPTVKSYYQLLEDMFVAFRVPAWTRSQRKNLLSTPRFFLFDMGVRHAAVGIFPSADIVRANPGPFFEQWVGIELCKRLQYLDAGRLFYLRSKTGAEIARARHVERPGALHQLKRARGGRCAARASAGSG